MGHINSLLTPAQVASLLQLNVLTIYRYLRSGDLLSIKIGKSYRIERKEYLAFLKKHKNHE